VVGSHAPATWHASLAAQTTGLAPMHAPAKQASNRVHALPSSHELPSGDTGLEQAPVVGSQVPGRWQVSLGMQTTQLEPKQTPAWQVSSAVHALPSLHGVPLGAGGLEQAPVVGSHVPATWHASLATHGTRPPAQTPAWHASTAVHGLPSSHGVPSGAEVLEQVPVAGLHAAVWHASTGVHTTGLAPVHTPALHVSTCVHGLPSLHGVPSGATALEQAPVAGSQVAVWHASAGVHTTWLAPVQTPAWQVSPCVHALPSLQAVPSGKAGLTQPPAIGSQVPAVWQASAVQTTGLPPVQSPATHVSTCVHGLPSLQGVPSGASLG